MTNKSWYQSKTVWASILQVLVGAAAAAGAVSPEAGALIQSQGPEVLTGLAASILGVVSFYGRVSAKGTIGKKTEE
jgi:hypothetical protein